MEKTVEQLARELRIRFVREVAVQSSQLRILEQQASGLQSKIGDSDKDRKAFLQGLLIECGDCIQNGTLVSVSGAIGEKYNQYIINAEMETKKAKAELDKTNSSITTLKTEIDSALAKMKEDVLAEKYERGELILTPKGLRRIIGRIIELNESINPVMGITLGKSDKCNPSATEFAWMCENSDQHPPLFFVDIDLMPLNKEELERICWENIDYQLLVKNISEDQIDWKVGTILRVNKNSVYEIYLVPYGEEKVNVIRIEKCEYPHWKVEILGKTVRSKENLKALCSWQGYQNAPVELEDASKNYNVLLSRMEWYFFKQYPGVILEMSQWEGERLGIS